MTWFFFRPPNVCCSNIPNLCLLLLFLASACDSANHNPFLQPFTPQVVVVGEEWILPIYASDPDGDRLSYSLIGAPEAMKLEDIQTEPQLRWAPLASDTEPGGKQITIVVIAEDGRGGRAEESLVLNVVLPGGMPEFTSPSGHVVHLAEKSFVAFTISVKDDDSATVNLMMQNGIPGAIFEQTTPKSGFFYWKPDQTQVDSSLVWTFTMVADDGVFDPVIQQFTLVLFQSGADPCPGTPPSVLHPHPQEPDPAQPIPIVVHTSELESSLNQVVLWWWTDDNEPKAEFLAPSGLDSWFVLLSLPALSPGDTAVLRYYLEATDHDDLVLERCDHTTRYPKTGHISLLIRGPDATACPADPWEPNDGFDAATPLPFGLTQELRACADDDWYQVDLPANHRLVATLNPIQVDTISSFELTDENGAALASWPGGIAYPRLTYGPHSAAQSVLVHINPNDDTSGSYYSLHLDSEVVDCTPDQLEPNDFPDRATLLNRNTTAALSLCPGDVDMFAIDLVAGSTLQADIGFDHVLGDVDAWLNSSDGPILAASTTLTSNERIVYQANTSETVLLVVAAPGAAPADYELSLVIYEDTMVCYDDLLAPNGQASDAVMLPIGLWSGLRLCPMGSDWFAHDTNGGELLTVHVATADGTIPTVRLWYGEPAILIAESVLSQGGASCSATTPGVGRTHVEVSTAALMSQVYQLQLSVEEPGGTCTQDRFEPNNNAMDAWRTPPTWLTRCTLCGDDSDWFEVDVPIFATLSALLITADPNAALRVELRSPDGEVVIQETTAQGVGQAETVVFDSGLWHVRVVDPDQSDQAYDLWLDVKN